MLCSLDADGPVRAIRAQVDLVLDSLSETFSHGADIGVRGIGRTREQAFEAAALALTRVIADPAEIRPVQSVPIRCTSDDGELLLCAWLNALVAQMSLRGMLFSQFEVSIRGNELVAMARGEAVDVARHAPAVEVKGATLTELRVGQNPDGSWTAQCIVDV
jgi:tRNA nucleotidyltransferase (CCA-adding enzyme)